MFLLLLLFYYENPQRLYLYDRLYLFQVRTISLFGEVWGVGPATALKLYERGHRSLDDLKNDVTLTSSQRLGLKYFEDIKTRIPHDEVWILFFKNVEVAIWMGRAKKDYRLTQNTLSSNSFNF